MIDTDKYEGYRPAPWRNTRYDGAGAHHIVDANGKAICTVHPNRATADLITDAPLLLAEVKRLKDEVEERITAHYTLANGWSRAEQEWEQEKRRLLMQIADMVDNIDNRYIRDTYHAADCLRDMIGYYEDEEE